jgi:hypothetical protein
VRSRARQHVNWGSSRMTAAGKGPARRNAGGARSSGTGRMSRATAYQAFTVV